MNWVLLASIIVGFVIMILVAYIIDLSKNVKSARDALYQEQLRHLSTKNLHQSWMATFDQKVEREVQKRVRAWSPSVEDIEAQNELADRMATDRETRDAGRFHPPVITEGEPARVNRISFRGGKSN